jgi:UDP-glucose 4-epimerase
MQNKANHPRQKSMNHHKSVVTGGAGFIGSHLVERLLKEDYSVTVLDNLTSGSTDNIKPQLSNPSLTLIKEDLKKPTKLNKIIEDSEIIFHFAANPEVRVGETDPRVHFEENVLATFNLLEAVRRAKTSKTIVFASTSTVYGEASIIPTPENYGPLVPISTYGASKLSCEALLSSYANTFDLRALILRFANIVGPRSNHGVIHDFVQKLQKSPTSLEILGDGNQKKSYMHIDDCISAILHCTRIFLEGNKKIDIYNIGSTDQITVKKIAQIIVAEMSLKNVKFHYTGGVSGGAGWKGDVKNMSLSIEKLTRSAWKPKYNSQQATKLTVKSIHKEKIP